MSVNKTVVPSLLVLEQALHLCKQLGVRPVDLYAYAIARDARSAAEDLSREYDTERVYAESMLDVWAEQADETPASEQEHLQRAFLIARRYKM